MKQKIVISENLKPIEKWVLSFVVPKIFSLQIKMETWQ